MAAVVAVGPTAADVAEPTLKSSAADAMTERRLLPAVSSWQLPTKAASGPERARHQVGPRQQTAEQWRRRRRRRGQRRGRGREQEQGRGDGVKERRTEDGTERDGVRDAGTG